MPQKRKSGYTTNDSFVVSDEDRNGSVAPQAKRSKKSPEIVSSHFTSPAIDSTPKRDSENNIYWEISKARRVTISDYKGKKMVSIREYYEKDGTWLPGKKGITMTLEQYAGLVSVLPGIEKELKRSGIEEVPRPNYDVVADDEAVKEEIQDEPEESEADEGSGGRANHEATSDEED